MVLWNSAPPPNPQTGRLIKTSCREREEFAEWKHEAIRRVAESERVQNLPRAAKFRVREPLSASIKVGVSRCERQSQPVCRCETKKREREENLRDMKQKVWSMDPSVTSLIKSRTFIRHGAFAIFIPWIFQSPPAGTQTLSAAVLQRRPSQFAFPLRWPQEKEIEKKDFRFFTFFFFFTLWSENIKQLVRTKNFMLCVRGRLSLSLLLSKRVESEVRAVSCTWRLGWSKQAGKLFKNSRRTLHL